VWNTSNNDDDDDGGGGGDGDSFIHSFIHFILFI